MTGQTDYCSDKLSVHIKSNTTASFDSDQWGWFHFE